MGSLETVSGTPTRNRNVLWSFDLPTHLFTKGCSTGTKLEGSTSVLNTHCVTSSESKYFRIKEKLLELADKKPEVRDKLVRAGLNDLNFVGNEKVVADAKKQVADGSKDYDARAFFQPTVTPSDNRPREERSRHKGH